MSPRHPHHKQSTSFSKRRRNRVVLICGLFVICILSYGFSTVRLTSLPGLNIDTININGVDKGTMSKLTASVFAAIQGKYLGLYPRSSVLIYPEATIIHNIKTLDPSANSVVVSHVGGTTLEVSIKENPPAAIVCTDYPDFSDGEATSTPEEDCYYADANANIFRKAPTISGTTVHKYYVPSLTMSGTSTGENGLLGQRATSTAEFKALQDFYTGAVKSGIIVNSIMIKDGGEFEMYINNPSKNDRNDSDIAVVYFNDDRPLADELANLASFWSSIIHKSTNRNSSTTFDYLDVRYGANVFYK